MIIFRTGNLLQAPVEALVNTVNTVGVMGKGIALQFKNEYPQNFNEYAQAVKLGNLQLGRVLVIPVNTRGNVKYVINFPTKGHWRNPSRLEWIESGLHDLKDKIKEYNIKSIALPPLGCGNGGLDWEKVRPLIESVMSDLEIDIFIYKPNNEIQEILKAEEKISAAKLTPVRAMLLQLLYNYRASGEFTSEFAAEKLSYFLQRFGEKQLKLNFQKGLYGPYSGKVRHILYAVNGYYLKGYEQKDAKPFEPLQIIVEKTPEVQKYIKEKLNAEERERVERVSEFIQGFESPYGLELLATVDFLIEENDTFDTEIIAQKLWSERKKDLFLKKHIEMAVQHLLEFRKHLYGEAA